MSDTLARASVRATPQPVAEFGLAEILAALSLVSDLARGRPDDEAMRACLVATQLGREIGLSTAELSTVYYTSLLRFVGCTATSHEYATAFGGDDIEVRRAGGLIDAASPREGLRYLAGLTRGRPPLERARRLPAALAAARTTFRDGAQADCEVGALISRRASLDARVERGMREMFERWDGKGLPAGLAGDQIALPARIAAVAYAGIIFVDLGGPDEAAAIVRRWAGHALDPSLAATFIRRAADLIEAAAVDDPLRAVVESEPGQPIRLGPAQLDEIAATFGDAVDLKAPFLAGHSRGVAELAEAAGRLLGLPETAATLLRRAGHLHDLGRAAVPAGTWERPGSLTRSQWEQVRLHPYHTERILSVTPALVPIARPAGTHHERLDGSGYHRGLPALLLDGPARVVAAADVYQALTSPRPHRPALGPAAAAGAIEAMALDRDAVGAVLASAGVVASNRRRSHPAGLSDREVEVLGLLVEGMSLKQIAAALVVAPSTAHTHVAHIYDKTGVSTRAGAAMFAMQHDLVRWALD